MKLIITLLVLSMLPMSGLQAQDLARQKMLLANFQANLGARSGRQATGLGYSYLHGNSQSVSGELLYGRVNRKNLLFAFGLQFSRAVDRFRADDDPTYKSSATELYPTILLQKFGRMNDRMFYTPNARMRFRYSSPGQDQVYQVNAVLHPLAFTIMLRQKIGLLLQGGELYVNNSFSRRSLPGVKSSAYFLDTNFMLNSFSAGLQFNL